ncbi:choline kinase [Clostridiales bacterium S5-A14a]|nr:choline kinase [Clostridiales bacterium S5-A14a]
MNTNETKVLKFIIEKKETNQRVISEGAGISIGSVNKSIKALAQENYLDDELNPTQKTKDLIKSSKPRNAIILAAGIGMRMVPINTQTPKGLLEIHGEPLIERIIKQLRDVGVSEIDIVVGFMKEEYEYLIDEYGVNLIINEDYSRFNNIYSLYLARNFISNTYIVPCDLWFADNPFNEIEINSWYMVENLDSIESQSDLRNPIQSRSYTKRNLRVNRKNEIKKDFKNGKHVWPAGVAYVNFDVSKYFVEKIKYFVEKNQLLNCFWEEAMYDGDKFLLPAKIIDRNVVAEINTYEQLRDLDRDSYNLKDDAIEVIKETFGVRSQDIKNIRILKKGMTNRSFKFSVNNKDYIMRIPGEGTENLIDRESEANIYQKIRPLKISDNLLYINPDNGYKITEYIHNSRNCDSKSDRDLNMCLDVIRKLHNSDYTVDNFFSIFDNINFYEDLWGQESSIFKNYEETKENVFRLKDFIDDNTDEFSLCHIDANPDNFIIDESDNVYLIDWEYAAMQDPLVDIAMFCIYAMYDEEEIDHFIDLYFVNGCTQIERIKIYCYIAACGLLWSNWCEYKRHIGVEFGEYSLRQYRYARDYYKLAKKEMEKYYV